MIKRHCKVRCQYRQRIRRYSGKTEGVESHPWGGCEMIAEYLDSRLRQPAGIDTVADELQNLPKIVWHSVISKAVTFLFWPESWRGMLNWVVGGPTTTAGEECRELAARSCQNCDQYIIWPQKCGLSWVPVLRRRAGHRLPFARLRRLRTAADIDCETGCRRTGQPRSVPRGPEPARHTGVRCRLQPSSELSPSSAVNCQIVGSQLSRPAAQHREPYHRDDCGFHSYR